MSFKNGRYIGPWFQQADPAGGGGNPQTPPAVPAPEPPKPADPLDRLTPEQQAEINRRMAAARRDGETTGKTAAERAATEAATRAQADKDQADQIAKGNFETVQKNLEQERDGLKSTAETAQGRLDRAIELLKEGITPKVKTLTEADSELAKAFPVDADILDQIAWLEDPRTKAVIDWHEAAQAQRPGTFGRSPSPAVPQTTDERRTAEAQRLAQTGAYTVL